jgi:hypothetical protein
MKLQIAFIFHIKIMQTIMREQKKLNYYLECHNSFLECPILINCQNSALRDKIVILYLFVIIDCNMLESHV